MKIFRDDFNMKIGPEDYIFKEIIYIGFMEIWNFFMIILLYIWMMGYDEMDLRNYGGNWDFGGELKILKMKYLIKDIYKFLIKRER